MTLVLLGFALLALTMLDVFWSTLTSGGGGPLTRRVARGLWKAALAVHRRRPSHRLLKVAGVVIVLAIVGLWIGLLWTAWMLIFSAEAGAVVASDTGAPASFWERLYFVGFTIYTLGMGDFVPQGAAWRVLTAIASLNGLFLVTLSITYLLPIVSAATEKSQLADLVSALGTTPAAIVRAGWNGEDFSALESWLTDLSKKVALHAERHLAYPVLHYFHNLDRFSAIAPTLAALDEALSLLAFGVAPEKRLLEATLGTARNALAVLLRRLADSLVEPEAVPPLPDLGALREAGIPTVSEEDFRAQMAALDARRRLLHGYVRSDGWTWQDVTTHF